jgi:hypothetical protein
MRQRMKAHSQKVYEKKLNMSMFDKINDLRKIVPKVIFIRNYILGY